MHNIKYRTISSGNLKADCYGGNNFDTIIPKWYVYSDGDKEGGTIPNDITFDAKHFPIGTRIKVEVPICPSCNESDADIASHSQNKCECGFDWNEWILDNYS